MMPTNDPELIETILSSTIWWKETWSSQTVCGQLIGSTRRLQDSVELLLKVYLKFDSQTATFKAHPAKSFDLFDKRYLKQFVVNR